MMIGKIAEEFKESPGLVALAGLGFGAGLLKYFVRPELTSGRAWAAIGLGVLAYEVAAPPNELLSEGADRALCDHPYLTRAAIGLTALHLANALPERLDPFHKLTGLK
jgi:hypothetical protein